MKHTEYVFRKLLFSDQELFDILTLLQKVYSKNKKFTLDYIKWQYLKNPNGVAVGYNVYKGDELAAHYATIPIVMSIAGELKRGLLSLNTATHPLHQGKRLFTQLADKTYELGKSLGYEFIIGVANANSTHGFLKNLGFYYISSLNVKLGIGKIVETNSPNFYVHWNEELIKWRLSNPSFIYFRSREYICCNKMFGVKAILKSQFFDYGRNNIISRKSIFAPVNLYVGLGHLCPKRYYNIPKFIKHSPFNLIFKDLTGGLPKISKEDIRFELFDFDVI